MVSAPFTVNVPLLTTAIVFTKLFPESVRLPEALFSEAVLSVAPEAKLDMPDVPKVTEKPEFEPVIEVFASSEISTAPVELKFSEPKLVVSPAPPRTIEVPLRVA